MACRSTTRCVLSLLLTLILLPRLSRMSSPLHCIAFNKGIKQNLFLLSLPSILILIFQIFLFSTIFLSCPRSQPPQFWGVLAIVCWSFRVPPVSTGGSPWPSVSPNYPSSLYEYPNVFILPMPWCSLNFPRLDSMKLYFPWAPWLIAEYITRMRWGGIEVLSSWVQCECVQLCTTNQNQVKWLFFPTMRDLMPTSSLSNLVPSCVLHSLCVHCTHLSRWEPPLLMCAIPTYEYLCMSNQVWWFRRCLDIHLWVKMWVLYPYLALLLRPRVGVLSAGHSKFRLI